jgi:hypothetical protein
MQYVRMIHLFDAFSKMGKDKNGEPKQPDMQNALFMAPQAEGDTWVKKAEMPTARVDLSTSVVNGIIYAIGGRWNDIFLQTVEAYDPKTDTWTKKADMPTPRQGLSTCVVDGIIYAIGGWNNSHLATVEAYDPKMDIWTKKTDMPNKRVWLSTSVVDGIIYAIGGQKIGVEFSTVETYDPNIMKFE